jgi:hypothetical protein
MKKINKKGQVAGLQGVIIAIVIIGLMVGVGFLLLGEFRKNLSTSYSATAAGVNVTPAGSFSDYNSTSTNYKCFSEFVIVSVVNESGTVTIPVGNYTSDYQTGKIYWIGGTTGYNSSRWNITLTYKNGEEACAGIQSTINATKNVPTFLPIVVIVSIVGVLLLIVFSTIGKGGAGRTAEV